MNRYIFQCREATIDYISSFSVKKILHLKGYASGLEPISPFPLTIMKIMNEFDVIVFDGDDLSEKSFTYYLASMAPLISQKGITLFAFKFAHHMNVLKHSWDNRLIEANEERSINILDKASDVVGATVIPLYCIEILYPDTENPLTMSTFTDLLHPNDHLYLYLGKKALTSTGARRVLAIGGGACLAEEYYHSDEGVEWIIYDHPRRKNGVEERTLLNNIELRNGHERIRHEEEENIYLIKKKSSY